MAKKIIGILLLIVGIYFLFKPITFNDYRTQTTGMVLAVNTENTYSITEHKNQQKTRVTVSYQTLNGQSIQFDTTSISPFASYKVGEKVPVMYDPKNPNNADLKDGYTKWYIPILFWIFGLSTLFGGLLSRFRNSISSNTNSQTT